MGFEGHCYIINGYYKTNKTWRENSRIKKLKVYINDQPLCLVDLADYRGVQKFNLAPFYRFNNDKPDRAHIPLLKNGDLLKFEILAVYPGSKYRDTAVTEFFMDGMTH